MSKAEMIDAIKGNSSKAAAGELVNALVAWLETVLKEEGKAVIHGIGTFSVELTKARTGRNPRTGEAIAIPAGKRVKFAAAKSLKDYVR